MVAVNYQLRMKKVVAKTLAKIALRLHTFFYQVGSFLAVRTENGLHPKHRLLNYHQFFLGGIKSGERVLDVGCGNGALAFDLAKKASFILAVDLDQKNIATAKKKFQAPNIDYQLKDATKDLINERFDVVILSNVLEHIENRADFLSKLRNLAPRILLRVPMLNRDWLVLYKKELGLDYRLDKGHFIEYTLENLIAELGIAGWQIVSHNIQFGEIWAVAKRI